jgi:hypothetical protein
MFRSFGEFEEQQLDDARLIQNRVDAWVTVGFNVQLLPSHRQESPGLAHYIGIAGNRVVLSENVGSCVHAKLLHGLWKRGFPHVPMENLTKSGDYFNVSVLSTFKGRMKTKYRTIPHLWRWWPPTNAAIQDAVRCLKHAMEGLTGDHYITPLTKIADKDAVTVDIFTSLLYGLCRGVVPFGQKGTICNWDCSIRLGVTLPINMREYSTY